MFYKESPVRGHLRICGIDSGTIYAGLTYLDIEYPSFKIIGWTVLTINSEIPVSNYGSDNMLPVTANRVFNLHDQTLRHHNAMCPTDIAIETPFFNRFRPGAFGPLSEAMGALKRAAFDYNPNVRFSLFPPSNVKVAVGASYKASKEEVFEKLMSNKDLPEKMTNTLHCFNEDEIDSLAVALTQLKKLQSREDFLWLY